MKIKTLVLVIILLLTTTLVYFFIKKNESIENNKLLEYYGINDHHKQTIEYVQETELITVKKIKNISVKDLQDISYELKDLVGNSPKLIVKFSSLECSYCIEHIIKHLKLFKDEINKNEIIFLGYFPNKKEFLTFDKLYKLNYQVFSIPENSLNIPLDNLNEPYMLFINDSTLKLKKAFVPIKSTPERTDSFLKKIKP